LPEPKRLHGWTLTRGRKGQVNVLAEKKL